jgi:hypothetical protein
MEEVLLILQMEDVRYLCSVEFRIGRALLIYIHMKVTDPKLKIIIMKRIIRGRDLKTTRPHLIQANRTLYLFTSLHTIWDEGFCQLIIMQYEQKKPNIKRWTSLDIGLTK